MRDEASDDGVFPPLSELVSSWMEGIGDTSRAGQEALTVSEVAVDIPFEMQFDQSEQAAFAVLRGSAPTQRTETTVLPVWHRLSVRYVLEET